MSSPVSISAVVDRGRASSRDTQLSPHKFECDDKLVYVVKPNSNDRQFANDLLAYAIAKLLGVPVFDAALVFVSDAFLRSSPVLANRYQVGIHFGSVFPFRNCFDGFAASPTLIANEVTNTDDFYTLAAFDEIIYNWDRGGNPGNVVFVQSEPPSRQFAFRAIDHGNAFLGPAWTSDGLDTHIPSPLVPVLAAARDLLRSRATLVRRATEVIALTTQFSKTIDEAHSGITVEERAAVTRFVQKRSSELVGWVSGPIYASKLPSLA